MGGIVVAVDLFEQRAALVEAQGWHIAGEAERGDAEGWVGWVAMDEPRVVAVAEETGILAGPGEIAIVPQMFGDGDRGGKAGGFGADGPEEGADGGVVVGCLGGGAFLAEGNVRDAREHLVAA